MADNFVPCSACDTATLTNVFMYRHPAHIQTAQILGCSRSKFYTLIENGPRNFGVTRYTFASENQLRTRAFLCLRLDLRRGSWFHVVLAHCQAPRAGCIFAFQHCFTRLLIAFCLFCHTSKETCPITTLFLSSYSHKEQLSRSFQ